MKVRDLGENKICLTEKRLYSSQTLSVIGWVIAFFPLAYPGCLNYYLSDSARTVLLLLMGLSSLFFILMCMIKHRFDGYIALVAAYCGVLVLSTIVNGGNVKGALLTSVDNSFLCLVGLTAAVSIFIKSRNLAMIDALLRYFELLILINLFTIVAFPGGMYSTGQEENFFLGFENIHSTTYLFALTLAFVKDKLYYEKKYISIETKILLVLCNLSVFLCTSSATIVQFVMLDFLFLFRNPLQKIRVLNAYLAIVFNIVISAFLIFFYSFISSQGWFRHFIVDILGKDLTFMSRTYIWNAFILMFTEKPILGYGVDLDSLLKMSRQYMGFGIGTSHAHNQYLTDAYYGGLIMLFFLLAIIFRLAKKISSGGRNDFNWFVLSVFFLSLFHWNTESLHMPLQIATFAIINNIDLVEKRSEIVADTVCLRKKKKRIRFIKPRRIYG